MTMVSGISVIICCHNAETRLEPVFRHLAQQKIPARFSWEVIVVDNASTDDTQQVVSLLKDSFSSMPVKVVYEAQLGLTYARERGLDCATYDIICWVDDDNWLADGYLANMLEVFDQHPDVGAVGGESIAVFDEHVTPPGWFHAYGKAYALGEQGQQTGIVTTSRGYLWGAGLGLRRCALQAVYQSGFESLLTDRKGKSLASGGDSEICFALRLRGWELWYDQGLCLQHYMPSQRINWRYTLRLSEGFGEASVKFDIYLSVLNHSPQKQWREEVFICLKRLIRSHVHNYKAFLGNTPGDRHAYMLRRDWGRLNALLRDPKVYETNWKKISHLRISNQSFTR